LNGGCTETVKFEAVICSGFYKLLFKSQPLAGYQTLKMFSMKSVNKSLEASLAGGGKRKRWISPYIFGTF
jgi:hypothetical protein